MKGKIVQWKDDKGFGFIQPEDGSQTLFFHVSSVKTKARRPQVGDSVLYEPMHDSQRRLKAKGVTIEGVTTRPNSPLKTRFVATKPPKKNVIDYLSFLVVLLSLAAAGVTFYQTKSLASSWPSGIAAVIAVLILSRQKKPLEKVFHCAGCRTTAAHDARSIHAWNNGFTKLYCSPCHRQWLKDNPKHEHSPTRNNHSGCLGVLAVMIVIPALAGIGLFQWLA
ncbi:cold shock domain-containing protein [Shewanella sp. NIFS-20-20]|uniref:cold shock domain-containing protein n=1 Tax=Shewanella sp. NIFS-20-20 TaxID=2853806 RepID=UPI001C4736F8|nr:cold shock domain-containing protein [Shewanella sp. NIFS-20-20]MBV7314424.1 cold shock domain-containing protein [Shewanella sp. NIFS-20-20]